MLILVGTYVAFGRDAGPDDPKVRYRSFIRSRGIDVEISSSLAENLLVHKEDAIVRRPAMGARIMGTVVIAIEIERDGTVRHQIVLTGPKLLQHAAIEAVRKYKYKPYVRNGVLTRVGSTVSMQFAPQ